MTYTITGEDMTTEESICRALLGIALADHLGDVHSASIHLYEALGIGRHTVADARGESPLDTLVTLARRFDLPVPPYALEDS